LSKKRTKVVAGICRNLAGGADQIAAPIGIT
jgi:hypothetical protein